MKDRLLKGRTFIRLFRLALGAWVTYYSLRDGAYLLLIIGIWLLLQAVLNISCCGLGCNTANKTHQSKVYKGEIKKYNPNKQ